ncbi:MAG: response regulator [Planctomycetota bacterium]
MKILIVDDSTAMRKIIIRTLRQAGFSGHEVVEAADGAEGLEKARSESPDLVLSDWNMPNMSGIEFLKAVRADGNQVVFGMITTEGRPEQRAEASVNGAQFLLAKPFTADDLERVIGDHMD